MLRLSSALLLLPVGVVAQSVSQQLDPAQWVFSEKNERIRPGVSLEGNGKVVNHLGRESLRLAKGFSYVRGLIFQNGTIDAELALAPAGNFIGIAFRVQSDDDYELFFFRNSRSGSIEAVQYTPGFGGANAWQLFGYPTYAGPADFLPNQWFHVRVVVAVVEAKLYVNGLNEPALVIPDLKQGYSKGSIGFWGQEGGGYVSNVTYTLDPATYRPQVKQEFFPGVVTNWEISDSFDVKDKDPYTYPADATGWKWEKVSAENPGMVLIQRYRRDPNIVAAGHNPLDRTPGSKVVFARTTINSEREEIRRMNIGYSDEVMVYLNTKPAFAGSNAFGSRQPDYLGRFNATNDAVYLPLKKGPNELMLAVTEFFGGWAFLCQLTPGGNP